MKKYNISVKDKNFEIEVGEIKQGVARVIVNGTEFEVRIDNRPDLSGSLPISRFICSQEPSGTETLASAVPVAAPESNSLGKNVIKAPIPGIIIDVRVKAGDTVKAGQTVIVMDAMKMENAITSPVSGRVSDIRVQKGSQVMTGAVLLVID